MYDNSIHKMAQPSSQPQHMDFAHQVAGSINELPLDQQNEVLLTVLKAVKDRRSAEVSEISLQSAALHERSETIRNFNERLKKEMESLRVSE